MRAIEAMNRASVARLGASPGTIPSAPFSISRTIVSTIVVDVVAQGGDRREVGRLHRHRGRRVEHELAAPLRVGRGQQHPDEAADLDREDRRPPGSRRVEDRDHVGDLRLEVGQRLGRNRIGQAGPAPIEVDEPGEPAQLAQEARVLGDLPDELDVVDPVVDEQQIDRAVANDLVGEVDVPVPGESSDGRVGHEGDYGGVRPSPCFRAGTSGLRSP